MLSHNDRFQLKTELLEKIAGDDWSSDRINILLSEFGAGPWPLSGWDTPSLSDIISAQNDEALKGMYEIAFQGQKARIGTQESSGLAELGRWKSGYVRVFFSHSAIYKGYVTEIADFLKKLGVHAFVAHESMEPTLDWQQQIEEALDSMEAFVAFIHPEFLQSAWCQQELGWALGRKVPHFAIRMGSDPAGFIGRIQWPSMAKEPAASVSEHVFAWLTAQPMLGEPLRVSAFQALADAETYPEAGRAAKLITTLSDITEAEFDRLSQIYRDNYSVRNGGLPTDQLRPLFEAYGKPWPPLNSSQLNQVGQV